MVKTIFLMLLVVVISSAILSCSDECDGENPKVKLVNNGTGKADIQIKTSGGNTENINNIQSGESSEYRSFAQGEINFTITIQGVQEPVEYELAVTTCNTYAVTINEDNSVGSAGTPVTKKIL